MPMRQRGFVLLITVVIAIVCAIAAYAALFIAMAEAQHAVFYRDRTAARYAAEAGLVWAQQQLWANTVKAQGCFAANPDLSLDHDGNPATPIIDVDVTLPGCGTPNVQLRATVVY